MYIHSINIGFRPVVHLKAGNILKEKSDGNYEIINIKNFNDTENYNANNDTTKPVITNLVTMSPTTLGLTATDESSGIVGYAVSTSNTTPTEFTNVFRTNNLSKTIPGLKFGTTYYVWVRDKAGHISNVASATTNNVKIGDIVKYVPNNSFTVSAQYAYMSGGSDQTFSSSGNCKVDNWNILSVRTNSIEMIPSPDWHRTGSYITGISRI